MKDDFGPLEKMVYSGRGIIVGATVLGNPFVVYTLTGRSPSSQARRLVYDEQAHAFRTDVTDPEQLKKGNPRLLIYPAVMGFDRGIVASNGTQTELLHGVAQRNLSNPGEILMEAFAHPHMVEGIDVTKYEPDPPNNTPRINACITDRKGSLRIIRKGKTSDVDSSTWMFDLVQGKGDGITTYKGGNENPLLPFDEEFPFKVNVGSKTPEDIVKNVYEALRGAGPEDYRVSAAVMMFGISPDKVQTAVINRHGDK